MTELYFEILHAKTHILCQAKDTSTVSELKKIVEGILKITPDKQTLKKPANESRTEWAALDEKQSLSDAGFSGKNAKADEPAVLALVLPEDNDTANVVPVSTPPPLPEAMRHRDQEFGEAS